VIAREPGGVQQTEKSDDSSIIAHLIEIKQKLKEAEEERKELKQNLKHSIDQSLELKNKMIGVEAESK